MATTAAGVHAINLHHGHHGRPCHMPAEKGRVGQGGRKMEKMKRDKRQRNGTARR